jgi:uncharacterized membrane protein YraQ (UPF0718 family)/copper chaperone CopZ
MISTYFKELWTLTTEMSAYLLFGFLFAGILHIYLKKESVGKALRNNSFRSVLNATLLGIPLPLCSCGVIPAGLSFSKNGASKGSTVSFLISTPQTGVDSILVTYSLLGLPFAIIRPIVALITGLAGGILTNRFGKNDGKAPQQSKHLDTSNLTFFEKTKIVLKYGFVDFIQDISKWLIIGLMLAALLAVLIPDNFFTYFVDKPLLNMLVVLSASVPLYICATGSVPIAAVLMMKGLSPGAALVFLMAGPATNIATIAVLGKELGRRTTLIYLFTIIGGAILSGLFIDTFLPAKWFSLMSNHVHHHEMATSWIGQASAVLLIGLMINAYFIPLIKSRFKRDNKTKIDTTMKIEKFGVEGMTCKNCKAHVENDVLSVTGVETVEADFVNGEIVIRGKDYNVDLVKRAVERGGYYFLGKKE